MTFLAALGVSLVLVSGACMLVAVPAALFMIHPLAGLAGVVASGTVLVAVCIWGVS